MTPDEIFEKIRGVKWRTKNYYISQTDIAAFVNTFLSPALINKDKIVHPIMMFSILNYLAYSLENVSEEKGRKYGTYYSIMEEYGYKPNSGGDGGPLNFTYKKPVGPGTVIYADLEIIALTQSSSRPDLWIWTRRWVVKDLQDGSVYMELDQNSISFYTKD
jgi:hypothetical protein